MDEEHLGPYANDVCQIRSKRCTKTPAAYERRKDGDTEGPFLSSCYNCLSISEEDKNATVRRK